MNAARSLILAALLASTAATAQTPTAIGHSDTLLIDAQGSKADSLTVTSPAFASGENIPRDATQYGANRFPGLTWSKGPAGTKSYLVAVQGVLGANGTVSGTSIHLTVLNLPATVTSLPSGVTTLPKGALYGLNVHGPGHAYAGPHTHGPARQPYHFEVFALDRTLNAGPDTSYADIASQMAGHVLASGDLAGYAAMPAAASAASGATKVVEIDTGLITGAPGRDPEITVYKGIPYAAPPVGDLRWKAPQPAHSWSGVRKMDAFGAACPQPGGMVRGMPQSEDCLTLNIWTGAKSSTEKRPVFVWIYGGGFIGGTGASPEFDGEGLARKGVIVVTFNYRVGVLGFLATPELSRESGHGASGNYGLLDDIAALKWVKRNIAAFGGDPDQVTIGGQSAGAGSVGFMAMSPLAKGLFKRGIVESHARDPGDPDLRFLSTSYRTLDNAEAAGTEYATQHGAHSVAEFRAMPWQKVIEGSDAVDSAVDTRTSAKPPLFRPVVGGWVLPRTYSQMLAEHAQNKVAIIAGNNKDETGAVPETAFDMLRDNPPPPRAGMPTVSVTLKQFHAFAHMKFGPLANEFLTLYPASNDAEAAIENDAQARDNNRVSTWLWATQWTKGTTEPVYTYWWSHAPPGPGHDMRGAYHGSEINYVFDNLYATDRPWTDEDRAIADRMSSYWANFIKAGNPNGAGLPQWTTFNDASPTVMQLGAHWQPVPIAGSAAKIAFWQRFYQSQKPW
jgi:para-nitrobenzyl esterase